MIQLAHIPDATQCVDFLTKWVAKDKLEASISYLAGATARAAAEGTNVNTAALHAMLLIASLGTYLD